uniref:Uncharacterized protein n=1 Tax=Caenorhabditis japonica TaxID=281687 RepID=A0A8R1IGG7_CAEJA
MMLKPDESRKRFGETHGKMALGWTTGACNGRRKSGGQALTGYDLWQTTSGGKIGGVDKGGRMHKNSSSAAKKGTNSKEALQGGGDGANPAFN